ncbi:hypothetical protein FA13DRAFT_1744132 [Coprinellus micaceus]|uniref:Uncharacterized protein n=1 Tax=Coprinellus micaceus TaxID=71717 RepID=A0A4Y7SCX8_COPMI|nr:hypothetical protein FA13DRAFT_1744132 [Coprinellus micaceus]
MVLFSGFLSFWCTPSAGGASLVLDATLLALTHQEQQRARTSAGHDSVAGSASNNPGANQTADCRSRQLPCTIRIPSLIVAFGLTCLWLAAVGFNLYFLSDIDALELYNWNYSKARIAAPILEVIFNVAHAGVFLTYIALGMKERKRLVGYREGRDVSAHELRAPKD